MSRRRARKKKYFDAGFDDADLKLPIWFWPLWIVGILGSLTILGLLIWAIIEIVPALARWLDRNQA